MSEHGIARSIERANAVSYRILLVEDNPGDAVLIDEALCDGLDVTVERAGWLEDALGCLATRTYDAVLLDLGLPDSEGIGTLSAVLARTRTPVVVLTGTDDESLGFAAIHSGAQDYLVKGKAGEEVLQRAVRYAVERARLQSALASPLLDTAPVGLGVVDRELRFLYVNHALAAVTGIPRGEHIGRVIGEVLPETAPSLPDLIRHGLETGDPARDVEVRVRGRRHGGDGAWLVGHEPVRDAQGGVAALTMSVVDITERRRGEDFRDALVGVLSHELRTPVTSIYGASTIAQRPGTSDEMCRELVADIAQEAERLGRLIEDLLVLARADRGALAVAPEPILLARVLPRVVEHEAQRSPARDIVLEVGRDVPLARGEESFVEQVARNLLANAAKYSPPAGRIMVVVDADGAGRPRVRVLDEGAGIDPDETERLFDMLYRSPRTSRMASGSGIGLFVARHLIESMGGRIWARPREDAQGAEFGFTLEPLDEDEDLANAEV
ncbi:MAG: ATP-binding protein [Chloroflexi bacterium]|nr:ATP-binding protein [Chloroflexota bacterium]